MLRIYVDFNTMMTDEEERVYINTLIQQELESCLRPGLSIVLYDEEMEVEAAVEFDDEQKQWLGKPDWSTRRDLVPH